MTSTKTPPRKWRKIGQPLPDDDGHRFFVTEDDPSRLYIVDWSGDSPDDTDDEPLRLLSPDEGQFVPVRMHVGWKPSATVRVAVEHPPDVDHVTSLDVSVVTLAIEDLNWLIEHGYIEMGSIHVDERLQPLFWLFERLAAD